MNEELILEHIGKFYKKKSQTLPVLTDINAIFVKGKFYGIMGQSGSGKSTLFNILGLLDKDYLGSYKLFGKVIKDNKDKELSRLRMENIDFIFQEFQLDPNLKAYENVMMPLYINKKIAKKDRFNLVREMLKQLNMENRIEHFPKELSGGEQQRIAIARALINNLVLILADEPTGNLDENMEEEIFKLLKELSKKDKCVIVVSHSNKIKEYADVIYKLDNGTLKVQNETMWLHKNNIPKYQTR